MPNLWILGSEKVEEEGECEDGNTVILSRYEICVPGRMYILKPQGSLYCRVL